MKVSKLIEQLQDFNPNADITLPCSEDICIGWICKDYKTGEELTKKTTPQLFIEFDEECPVCVHSYIDDGERFCSYYDKHCADVEECYQFEEME